MSKSIALPSELVKALEVLGFLPTQVVLTTTNGLYVRVYTEKEVWEFKGTKLLGTQQHTIPVVGKGNIKTLGYPVGLSAWGHALSEKVTGCDYALLSMKVNGGGKTRVKFTLEKDIVIAHRWMSPIIIKAGVYDYLIPTPPLQDWTGWFND